MMRGVSFEISQEVNTTLWKIFNCIEIEKYSWYIVEDQEEVWDGQKRNSFFTKDYYDGKEFSQYIQTEHYIVFLKAQAYFKDSVFSNLHTYKDFLSNDCQILLLINDCEFVEIYCKDVVISKKLFNCAIASGFKKVTYITNDNDLRTKMDIL